MSSFPNELLSDDEKWIKKCQQLRQMWCEKKSDKEIKQEIGQWFHEQKLQYKNETKAMSKPELRQEFEQLKKDFPQYFLTDEENWQVQFSKVEEYMQQNTNRPHHKMQLSRWLYNQLEYYKARKYHLAKDHIHKQFKDFLLKHSQQFSNYI